MTLQEAAYNILNMLVGGRSTNNEYISADQIKFNIKHYRALLARRDTDILGGAISSGGGQGGSHNSGTSLIELEQELDVAMTNLVITPDAGVFPDNTLSDTFISVDVLPKYVRLKGRSGITRIAYNNIAIPLLFEGESVWRKYNKYSTPNRYCYIDREEKLVLVNFTIVAAPFNLDIRGVFEDPEEVYNFNNPATPWDDDVNEFPLPLDMYQRIADSLVSGAFRLILDTPNDTELNTLPDNQLARVGG